MHPPLAGLGAPLQCAAMGEAVADGAVTQIELALHATASDCWVVIKNQVFDMTAWFNGAHPGGMQAQVCGQDDRDDAVYDAFVAASASHPAWEEGTQADGTLSIHQRSLQISETMS